MQMTERLVTKAAASAARAQPAESRDRKYDKHLSYSATWGRSAGQTGSRGGGGDRRRGAKIRPRGTASTLPARLSRQTSLESGGEGGSSSVRSWDTPRRPRLRTHQRPAEMSEPQDGGSSWSRGQKMPLARGGLRPTLEMGHQVNSTFGVGRSRVALFVAGRPRWQSPRR